MQSSQPPPDETLAIADNTVSLRDILHLPHWDSLILPGWRIYHHPEAFRNRVWISLLLTLPVFIFSPYFPAWFGLHPPVIPGIHYISFVLGLLVYLYGGIVFIEGAFHELHSIRPGMMTLAALAITLTMGYSTAVTFGFPGTEIYLETAILTVLMLLGYWLTSRTMMAAGQMLLRRAALNPLKAMVIDGDLTTECSCEQLEAGQHVFVKAGEVVPVDGIVEEGSGLVDESMITGITTNNLKQPGDEVLAGSTSRDSDLKVRVTHSGPNTFLAGSTRLIFELQNQPDIDQIRADRAAYWLVVGSIVAASLTAIFWAFQGKELVFIIERVAAVLVAVSPPALSLAIPMVLLVATAASMENGVLIVNRNQFRNARRATYAVFSKTGTLTRGQMQLQRIYNLSRIDDSQLLQWAASVESASGHPAARAIAEAASGQNLPLLTVEKFEDLAGIGVAGTVEGRQIRLGGAAMLAAQGALSSGERRDAEREASLAGLSIVYMQVDEELTAVLALADLVRTDAATALRNLHRLGVRTAIVSGDSEAVTQRVAAQLDVINYISGVTPQGKARHVKTVQQREPAVAMVGDPEKDAPALAQADISFGMGFVHDVTGRPVGLMLLKGEPQEVARMIQISRLSHRKILQNLIGAIAYNAVAILLAAGILAGLGLVPPLVAIPLVMFASVLVVIHNSRRLRRHFQRMSDIS